MRRIKGRVKPQGGPVWLMTFADMMLLLLTFFVLMLALSSIDLMRYQRVVNSIQHSFGTVFHQGGPTGGDSDKLFTTGGGNTAEPIPPIRPAAYSKPKKETPPKAVVVEEDPISMLQKKLGKTFLEQIQKREITLTRTAQGVSVRFAEQISFDSADSKIGGDFIPLLSSLSATLKGGGYSIIIEGHTDNRPVLSGRYSSNWSLSSARAASVAEYMVQVVGVSPNQVIAQGRGPSVPIAPNDTPDNQRLNRRVEVIVSPLKLGGEEVKSVGEQSN
jgi:chemotaxis protein MotB